MAARRWGSLRSMNRTEEPKLTRALSSLILAAQAATLLAACDAGTGAERSSSEPKAAAPKTALTVSVAPVAERAVETRIIATGTLAPWRELVIGARLNGLAVMEIAVEEGQRVRKGDLLVRLDDAALLAQIAQQNAQIDEAAANVASARRELARAEQLVATKSVSQQTLDERSTTVKANEAKLAAAQATLKQIEVQLSQTRVLAPDDGYILKRSVSLAQVVSVGAELVRMVQRSRLEVQAAVPDSGLLAIHAGDTVRVVDPSGRERTGTVREIAPGVDAVSRLGTVRIDLAQDEDLRPGMFVRVEIASEPRSALAVPRPAVVWRTDGPGVFVLRDDGRVALSPVVIGRQMDDFVEVVSGVAPNQSVVSRGAAFLNDGDRVDVDSAAARVGARATGVVTR